MSEVKQYWSDLVEVLANNPDNPGVPDLDTSDYALIFEFIASRFVGEEEYPLPEDRHSTINSIPIRTRALVRANLLTAAKEARNAHKNGIR